MTAHAHHRAAAPKRIQEQAESAKAKERKDVFVLLLMFKSIARYHNATHKAAVTAMYERLCSDFKTLLPHGKTIITIKKAVYIVDYNAHTNRFLCNDELF
jgi:hypothetical protein